MNIILWILVFVLLFAGILYALMMLAFTFKWLSLPIFAAKGKVPETAITIVIPARNEEEHIVKCLQNVLAQNYPQNLTEIIVVDDNSTDNTAMLVEKIIAENPDRKIRLLKLKDVSATALFKKRAITEAVAVATGKLIVTTDADCRMGSNWLANIAAYYELHQPKMVLAPVTFSAEKSIFEKLQTLEFIGYIGVSAAAVAMKNPLMCNGANLAYEREAFNAVGGYKHNDNLASGDDVFLMLKIKKMFPGAIHFLKSKEAIVETFAQKDLNDFFQQRKRWLSKRPGYTDFSVIGTALLVYAFNFFVLLGFVLSFFADGNSFAILFALLFLLKCFSDFVFLYPVAKFFGRRELLWWFLPEQVLVIIYVTLMGIIGSNGKYKWKGRELK
ncbi:MAG: glycosyltransferase [Bacteroidia bacterium]